MEATLDTSASPSPAHPVVTLVMPTYRRNAYLKQALTSVLAQSYPHFEAHVFDNGNEAECRELCDSFGDARVFYHPRPVNLGLVANATDGLASATTPFVMEVDDDDLLEPHALSVLVRSFEDEPDAAVAFGRYSFMNADGHPLEQLTQRVAARADWDHLPPGRVADHKLVAFALGSEIRMSAALFRTNCVDWRSLAVASTAYDTHLLLMLATRRAGAVFADEPITRIRHHSSAQSSAERVPQLEGHRVAVIKALEQCEPADVPNLQKALDQVGLALGWDLDRSGNQARAREICREMIDPWSRVRAIPLRLWMLVPSSIARRARILKSGSRR